MWPVIRGACQLQGPRAQVRGLYGATGGATSLKITIANYDVTRDGQRFIMVKDESTAARLNVVLNWFTDLNRSVPAAAH